MLDKSLWNRYHRGVSGHSPHLFKTLWDRYHTKGEEYELFEISTRNTCSCRR